MTPLTYLKLGGVAVAALSLSANVVMFNKITDYKVEVKGLQDDVNTARAFIVSQNEGIEALTKQRAADRIAYDKAVSKARGQVAVAASDASRVLSLPQPDPDRRCEAAKDLLLEGRVE